MTNTVIYFTGIILTVIAGTKLKINIGLVAAAFAFLISPMVGIGSGEIISRFPTTLFVNYMLATCLFGFAGYNGTLKSVARLIIYRCRNTGWMLGMLFFLVTVFVAALGAGGSAPFFMSALVFGLALQAGISPLLVSLSIWTGSMVGGGVPWTSGYATNVGQLEIYFDTAVATQYVNGFYQWRAIFYTIIYLAAFFLLKGWKVDKKSICMEHPEALNKKQKQTVLIIFGVICTIMLPSAFATLAPGSFASDVKDIFGFQTAAALGIVANILLKTAPYESVLKERVPWDTLLMLTFTGMYMALAEPMGVLDYLTGILQNQIPKEWIIPGIVLLMCILSFFVSGRVVIPMMLPLVSVFSQISGSSAAAVYCAMQIGLTASSISPFSQGGAAALSGCDSEDVRRKLLKQQTILSGVFTILIVVIAAFGGFSML